MARSLLDTKHLGRESVEQLLCLSLNHAYHDFAAASGLTSVTVRPSSLSSRLLRSFFEIALW